MANVEETRISRAIISAYHQKLSDSITGDVLIVGGGPAGLTAAFDLAGDGFQVTVLEKRLSIGGGVWGGGMAMSEAVVQDDALALLQDTGIRHADRGGGLHTVDAVELATGLCVAAMRAGATVLNLTLAEDLCMREDRVVGVVANRSMIAEALPIDPITFTAKAVVDATGHEAALVACLRRRGLLTGPAADAVEGPMNAAEGEQFVVDRAGEVYPGLWVAGMTVCATFGGPRMGPIFGGMLLSGRRIAALISRTLKT